MLSPEQIALVREILQRRHWVVLASLFGADMLSEDERAELAQAGIDVAAAGGDILSAAFELGRIQGPNPSAGANRELESIPELSDDGARAVEAARATAAVHVRNLTDRVLASTGQLLTAEQQRAAIRSAVGEAQEQDTGFRQLRSELGKRTEDWERDLERLAHTELHTTRQLGQATKIRERNPGREPLVYKVPAPDACPECQRLHVGPSGAPRVFPLSSLAPSNVGRRRADWVVTVGSTHPNCTCELRELPNGWGFDEDGDAMPGAPIPDVYGSEEEIERAVKAEDDLYKGALHGQVHFGGLPINIENPAGSVRKWGEPGGKQGETRMLFAYGEFAGTRGADGDPVDVFIGPNPASTKVFVVHQRFPRDDRSQLPAHAAEWGRQGYDEDKVFVGFDSQPQVVAAYDAHYDRPGFRGAVSMMQLDELREALYAPLRPGREGMLKSTYMARDPLSRPEAPATAEAFAGQIQDRPKQPQGRHPAMNLTAYAADLRKRAREDRESMARAKVDPRDVEMPRGWGPEGRVRPWVEQADRAQASADARAEAEGNRQRVEQEAARRRG